jgi:hypothetical protein
MRWWRGLLGAMLPALLLTGGCGESGYSQAEVDATVTAAQGAVIAYLRAVATETPTATTSPEAGGIWAYCREIGTSPGWLENPPVISAGYVFRCYQGRPLQCETGATAGACMKLSDAEPSNLAEYCREHPDERYPPFSIVGHAPNVFSWGCVGGEPFRSPDPQFDPKYFDELGFCIPCWQVIPEPYTGP